MRLQTSVMTFAAATCLLACTAVPPQPAERASLLAAQIDRIFTTIADVIKTID